LSPPGAPRSSQNIFTEGRKGHEETGVGTHQISKQALFLPLITETPTALRDLGVKTISRTTARPTDRS
jgi:hypothetical protein